MPIFPIRLAHCAVVVLHSLPSLTLAQIAGPVIDAVEHRAIPDETELNERLSGKDKDSQFVISFWRKNRERRQVGAGGHNTDAVAVMLNN